MQGVLRVKGIMQHYAWGGKRFIPNLLGLGSGKEPTAEYWLGAHIKSPSQVNLDNTLVPLDRLIGTNAQEVLGEKVFKHFGRLPFLFKVLDVHNMLSIQVHPTKKEAEIGFEKEENKGISLTAFNRNYKDDNHKPEIMVALGDFWLLHGFLPKIELLKVLKDNPEFSDFIPIFHDKGYKGLYQYVMELPSEEVDQILQPLMDRIIPLFKGNKLSKNSPDFWAAKAVIEAEDTENIDKGIFSIYFFNLMKLQDGEAVFQDAGVPHAYLEGQNIELMANSDNVLRGGLTPKHIDVPELLKHVKFEETKPEIMLGFLEKDGLERKYLTPAIDFELSKISLGDGSLFSANPDTLEIYLLMDGEADISEGETSFTLKKGESFLAISGAKFQISTADNALFYKATTPVDGPE